VIETPYVNAWRSTPNSTVTELNEDRRHESGEHKKPRRSKLTTRAFWLGGIVLSGVGSIIGASVSCCHPVAVSMSALWWGVYLGCLGSSIGTLLGLCIDRSSTLPEAVPVNKDMLLTRTPTRWPRYVPLPKRGHQHRQLGTSDMVILGPTTEKLSRVVRPN
jgi:hypothetical protein